MNLPIWFLTIFVLTKNHLPSASPLPYANLRQLQEICAGTITGGSGCSDFPILSPVQPVNSPTSTLTGPQVDVGGIGGISGTGVGAVGVAPAPGSTLIIRRGIDCGYAELNAGDVIQISSRNYNVSNYFNNEACTWKFEGNRCTLSTYCPCVDFPPSPFCLEDYLRITDKYNFDQRYCGGNSPGRPLVSNSDSLTIRYRTDRRTTATGFVCYVSCAAPGFGPITNITEGTPCPNATPAPVTIMTT